MEILAPDFGLIAWTFIFLIAIVSGIAVLIDLTRSVFRKSDEKTYWMVQTILLPLLGSILYLIYGRRNRIKQYKKRNGIFQ